MDRLYFDVFFLFKVFSDFGDEHVHTAAEEVIVFAPNAGKDVFALNYAVGGEAEETKSDGLFLSKPNVGVGAFNGEVGEVEMRLTDLENELFLVGAFGAF